MNHRHYTRRPTWRPLVVVRWRSRPHGCPDARLGWRLYLFGVLPVGTLPRRESREAHS